MIVYNVARRWFHLKNDAEAHRRELGLPPEANFKLEIYHREELAALLNGLMGLQSEPTVAPVEVIERNQVQEPDYVPTFLVKSWTRLLKEKHDDTEV